MVTQFRILTACLFLAVLSQTVHAASPEVVDDNDKTTYAIGPTAGGFMQRNHGGLLIGAALRLAPLSNKVSVDFRFDYGHGIPKEGRDSPPSVHIMFGLNTYLPYTTLRWVKRKNGSLHSRVFKSYVSTGVGVAGFKEFQWEPSRRFGSRGGPELNAALGLEFCFNRGTIFFMEPYRYHLMKLGDMNTGRKGFYSVKIGFMKIVNAVK